MSLLYISYPWTRHPLPPAWAADVRALLLQESWYVYAPGSSPDVLRGDESSVEALRVMTGGVAQPVPTSVQSFLPSAKLLGLPLGEFLAAIAGMPNALPLLHHYSLLRSQVVAFCCDLDPDSEQMFDIAAAHAAGIPVIGAGLQPLLTPTLYAGIRMVVNPTYPDAVAAIVTTLGDN